MRTRVRHRRHRAYPALTNAFSIASIRGLKPDESASKIIAPRTDSNGPNPRVQGTWRDGAALVSALRSEVATKCCESVRKRRLPVNLRRNSSRYWWVIARKTERNLPGAIVRLTPEDPPGRTSRAGQFGCARL